MSLKLPTVSIIISAYEGISYLPGTINSILQQTYDNFEILVFSDCCRQISSWFQRQPDYRCRFILQSNLGISTTFNQGILEARGKYLAFVRAGDLWHPSKLQRQIPCLDRDLHVGLIHSWWINVDHQGKSTGKIVKQAYCELFASYPDQNQSWGQTVRTTPMDNLLQPSEILAQYQISLSSVMVRRDCFQVVGLFDPNVELIPDWEMWIRLSHYYQFIAIAEPLVYCRQQGEREEEYWLTLETDLQTTIETVYARLSTELGRRKHLSYAYASVFLVENTLQHKYPDLVIARNYWYQALQHDPLIVFSLEFCRLRWTIFILHCAQSNSFQNLRRLAKALVRQLTTMIRHTRKHGQNILNWMLEEENSISFGHSRKVKQQGKD